MPEPEEILELARGTAADSDEGIASRLRITIEALRAHQRARRGRGDGRGDDDHDRELVIDAVEGLTEELVALAGELRSEIGALRAALLHRTGRPVGSDGDDGDAEVDREAGEAIARSVGALMETAGNGAFLPLEGLLVYSLVRNLSPQHCLGVGGLRRGGAEIVCRGLDDNGFGRLVWIDPGEEEMPPLWRRLGHRAELLLGPPAERIAEAGSHAGAHGFGLLLLDLEPASQGEAQEVLRGALPLLSRRAHLLVHDAFHHRIADEVRRALADHPELTDGGMVGLDSVAVEGEEGRQGGRPLLWKGLRLLHFRRRTTGAEGAASRPT